MITLKLLNPSSNIIAITIYPFIITRRGKELDEIILRHEKIHVKQQLELLVIPFYLWYGIEWLIRKIFGRGDAYASIGFERESYVNQDDKNYLKNRKFWNFIKYI